MKTLVFSHGFGVKADSNGLFTQIAAAFPHYKTVLFDYNTDLGNGTIELASLTDQAQKLQDRINAQSGEVIIVAHSQGCVVAGLADLNTVSKVILLAPPVEMNAERLANKLLKRPGAEINLDGVSKLPRSDGTTTLIPKAYIDSIESVNPIEIYTQIASKVETIIVRSTEDEILGLTNVNEVPNAKHIDIKANHNFTGTARDELISILMNEINR